MSKTPEKTGAAAQAQSPAEPGIIASPNDFNIRTLYDYIKEGCFIIPDFQRNYVWNLPQASKLMESILLGLPIPQIFLYEEASRRYLVIDGQQRLMSIYYFMSGRFPRPEKRDDLRNQFGGGSGVPDDVLAQNDYFRQFKLSLKPRADAGNLFHGRSYKTLNEDQKHRFDMFTLRAVLIKPKAQQDGAAAVYEIFNRLNTGGANLKSQEIRNCLYRSPFYDMLFRVNQTPLWRNLIGKKGNMHSEDVEMILRGFAMLIDIDDYKSSTSRFLNSFSAKAKEYGETEIKYLEKLFLSFLKATGNLPKGILSAKGKRSVLAYEAIFAAACRAAYKSRSVIKNDLKEKDIERIMTDAKFIEASRAGTASIANIQKRLIIARKIIKG